MRTLKWTPLPESKLNSTFWRTNTADVPNLEMLINADLEDMFSADSPSKKEPKPVPPVTPKKAVGVTLLDIKRANNIGNYHVTNCLCFSRNFTVSSEALV